MSAFSVPINEVHVLKEEFQPPQVVKIYLSMQGTWVQPPVWEDSTCHGAAKPVCHIY